MTEGALARLIRAPSRFRFGAAVRLLWLASGRRDVGEAIAFTAPTTLAHPVAEVDQASAPVASRAKLVSRLIGLIGASSPLPRWYTELVAQANRARSPAMADFFALLAQRLVAAFAEAGTKYHPHLAAEIAQRTGITEPTLAADPAGQILLALTGFNTRHLIDRLAVGAGPVQYYAGFFASRPRSADRLRALLSDWLERNVEIEEFAGGWLRLDPDSQSRLPRGRLPGQFNRLGLDCAAGARAFDQQARFLIRIGPLSHPEFEALLPDRERLHHLVSLVRAYVGMEVDFAVNLILDPDDIPLIRLGGTAAPRLSWTGWLPSPAAAMTGRPRADQAVFNASTIEVLSIPRLAVGTAT
ncbi:MAG: type VI secretion system baseplate subunit TssG [Acidiphilium sp.]|nr:type VI secretion system baseplate subunit TssG [Acidiphilium sp.]MDD4936594.1 type VI secretion system baseplate subunit TssG [Acidiphilium sp.]